MIRKQKTPQEDSLICDFTGGAVAHRFRFGGGRGQALARAVGMKGGHTPTVVDATAGLGRDAFLLASLGAEVTLIERSPVMHGLLQEGMDRARDAGGDIAAVISRMTLMFGDARDLLPGLSPDVVLVDPMHPERTKTALVKNEMRLLRKIVGSDPDAAELMKTALATAGKRVVLKWPLRAGPMQGIGDFSHQILGKSTRYDVFMVG
ncbi:MAG: class I SAM-dependent methyltransferase [Rhodospirillales bacterium]|nr:class I SAM-dependent methyltransferase [Rhodospirillales bacterium]